MLWSVIVKRNNRKLAFDKKEIFQHMDYGEFAVKYQFVRVVICCTTHVEVQEISECDGRFS